MPARPYQEAKRAFLVAYTREVFFAARGHIPTAAALAGMRRQEFYRKMRKAQDIDPHWREGPFSNEPLEPVRPWRQALAVFNRHYFEDLKYETGGNICTMARLAKTDRWSIYRNLRQLKIPLDSPDRAARAALCAHRGRWDD